MNPPPGPARPPIASMADNPSDSAEYRRNGRIPIPEPSWLQIPRNIKIGGAMLLAAALIGPAFFGVAVVEQMMLANAVNAIERDPSCAAPIAQRLDGACLTLSARVERKYIDGPGWGATYHVVAMLPRRREVNIAFVHAPTLYRRMYVGHAITVRMLADAPFQVGVRDEVAAAGDGPLPEERATWAGVRYAAVTFMFFEVLVLAVFLVVKHVRRGALPAGQDNLWS